MEKLTIQILASDFEDSYYMKNDDCVLTRAYKRAGKNWLDSGTSIINEDIGKSFLPSNYVGLSQTVRNMYDYLGRLVRNQGTSSITNSPISPIDFDYVLEY